MRVVFACGCSMLLTGREEKVPLCPVHGTNMERIIAPPPKVRGTVSSPLKES